MFAYHKYRPYVTLLIALGLLTSCSGVKTYPNTLDKNLHVTTKTDSSVDATVEIYKVESNCSFLSGSSTTTYSALLRPRTGLKYDIDVSYMEDIYNVVINERRGSTKSREIEAKSLAACKPL